MEKLTRERIAEIWSSGGGFLTMLVDCWQAIEADRETIREETRAEVLKDHFANGDVVETLEEGHWVKGEFRVTMGAMALRVCHPNAPVRRPAKTRPMTREEKLHTIKSYLQTPTEKVWEKMGDEWLDVFMAGARLPTEVQE